ncbi:MAG: F0F1 ATP synthase subunit A [Candidatus Saccharimonadales bacterium]
MNNFILLANSESGIHISLKAEPLMKLGPISVTNSFLFGLVISIVAIIAVVPLAKKIKFNKINSKKANILEFILEFVISTIEAPLGSRKLAIKLMPYFATYMLFILLNNTLGLLPIVGPSLTYNGTPLFRAFTADLNGTIAMAAIGILMVQYLSIKIQGGKNHFQHYFTDKPLNPINLFIGLLEVFGELTRTISLSLRLFLNTAVGEILVAVFTSIILAGGRTPLVVLPILIFEFLVAGIQSYIFTVLCANYLGLAIAHHQEHSHEHSDNQSREVEAIT